MRRSHRFSRRQKEVNSIAMQTLAPSIELSPAQIEQWQTEGYVQIGGLFSPAEVDELREHFMQIQREALDENSPLRAQYQPASLEEAKGDILKHYPRVGQPHRFDELSLKRLLDARIEAVLTQLMQQEPIAAQSMFYFKPMGARGQALHQDNFYLNVQPATCVAAWVAVDDADPENGGMSIVPRSHLEGVLCPHMADMDKSFTTEEVAIPQGLQAVPAIMEAGDVLFFGGETIHGSTPNISRDRFRRAFICHYVPASTTAMSHHYFPLLRFNGEEFEAEKLEGQLNTCGAEDWATYQKLRESFLERTNAAAQ